MMWSSVRFRVTAVATCAVALVLVAMAVVVARLAETEARSAANKELAAVLSELAAQPSESGPQLVVDTQFSVVVDGQTYELGIFDELSEQNARGELSVDGKPTATLDLDLRTKQVVRVVDVETGLVSEDAELVERLESLTFDVIDIDGDSGKAVLVGATTAAEVEVSVAAIWRALLFTIPPLVLVFGVMVWLIVGRALGPVQAMSERVDAISSKNLDQRIPVPAGNDEVADLAAVMNRMLDRLEDGDQKQRQFSADASHELQSPLATVRTAAELIQRRPTALKVEAWAGQIMSEADRMAELISDLLLLSRSSDEANKARWRPTLASELLDPVRSRYLGSALDGDRVEVEVCPPSNAIELDCDPAELGRALDNLCSNAVRHAMSKVRISMVADDLRIALLVEDDGPGVDFEDNDRIFERFVRSDAARSRDTGGSGLGLAIVRAAARRHGGCVRVGPSEDLGGARFVLQLPLGSASGAPVAEAPVE